MELCKYVGLDSKCLRVCIRECVCGGVGWPMTQGMAKRGVGVSVWVGLPIQERLLPASWKPGSHWQENEPGTLTQRC